MGRELKRKLKRELKSEFKRELKSEFNRELKRELKRSNCKQAGKQAGRFDRSMSGQNSPYIFTRVKLRLFKFDNTNCHGHSSRQASRQLGKQASTRKAFSQSHALEGLV